MEKLPLKKRIFFFCVEHIAVALIRLIYLTCRAKFSPQKLPPEPCIVVFWHGRLAMMSYAYNHYWKGDYSVDRKAKVIISDHKDGEIFTRVISHFGIGAIRGSSSKGAVRALMNAFSELKNGTDVVITPDGPRGPIYSVADGAVTIAQKKNLKIYALNYEANRFWQFKSWDQMILPKPFSRINYSLSEPLDIADMELESAKEAIRNLLFAQAKNDKIF